jgi:hypothetical protein
MEKIELTRQQFEKIHALLEEVEYSCHEYNDPDGPHRCSYCHEPINYCSDDCISVTAASILSELDQ